MEPRNRFQEIDSASLCSLAGRYDNHIPARFLDPIACSKIPALLYPPFLSGVHPPPPSPILSLFLPKCSLPRHSTLLCRKRNWGGGNERHRNYILIHFTIFVHFHSTFVEKLRSTEMSRFCTRTRKKERKNVYLSSSHH